MRGGLFDWTMRGGAKLLFAIALLLFAVSLVTGIWSLSIVHLQPFGPENEVRGDWLQLFEPLVNAVAHAVPPLIGAIIVDRLDRLTPAALDRDV